MQKKQLDENQAQQREDNKQRVADYRAKLVAKGVSGKKLDRHVALYESMLEAKVILDHNCMKCLIKKKCTLKLLVSAKCHRLVYSSCSSLMTTVIPGNGARDHIKAAL